MTAIIFVIAFAGGYLAHKPEPPKQEEPRIINVNTTLADMTQKYHDAYVTCVQKLNEEITIEDQMMEKVKTMCGTN